jgi:16S rRNA (guanine527-N7)-methyltransferase
LTPETTARLHRFADLLTRWSAALNLVAKRDVPLLWDRHIEDSLQLLPLIPPGVPRAIDLGTGGGFPGLVLAIATGIPFDLVESDLRKAAFLRTAVQETAAPATVHATRIEDARLAPALLVTARALAPLPRLLPLAAPLLAPDGILLLLKGAAAEEELAGAADWAMDVQRTPSRTHPDGTILRIANLRRR